MRIKQIVVAILLSTILCGCANQMANFNQYAYVQTTSIKVDALNIMDMAEEEYSQHKKEVALVRTQMQKAYEYEKNRSKNGITVEMWQTMMNPSGKMFGGFVSFWEKQNSNGKALSRTFIDNEKEMIGKAFDQIAQLESKKIK